MTGEEAKFSPTEVQMIMQMMSDIRGGISALDHKLDGMVPRPEFVQYQTATDRRFAALEGSVSQKRADHAVLESKIEAVDQRVDSTEKERHEGYRSLNTKAWFALGAAVLSVVGGVIAQALGG